MAIKSNICRADTVHNSIEMMILNTATTETCASTSSSTWPNGHLTATDRRATKQQIQPKFKDIKIWEKI